LIGNSDNFLYESPPALYRSYGVTPSTSIFSLNLAFFSDHIKTAIKEIHTLLLLIPGSQDKVWIHWTSLEY